MAAWWKSKRASLDTVDDLRRRVRDLETQLARGRGQTLSAHMEDYVPCEGVYRDEDDNVLGLYDPHDSEVRSAQFELVERTKSRVPRRVQDLLDRAGLARWGDVPMVRASSVAWRDTLTPRRVLIADGAQVLNTVTETIMCPDFTFAADYFEHGDAFKYTLLGDLSGQAAANTHTFRLRYGGAAGTSMAASGAFAWDPTAASTTVSEMVEYYFVCRSTGTAGSFFTMGRLTPADFDDASVAALVANLNMLMIPTSAPAAVGSLDTTTAKAVSPTVTFSSATATVQWTNHIAILESLN